MDTWRICAEQLTPGSKRRVMLKPSAGAFEIPATLINGARPGKTVLISAGVHGDEYPGISAAIQTANALDPAETTGRIMICHCVNISGFWAHTRHVAEDGVNLNAIYPGKSDGTVGERVADFFVREVFPQMDFIIDLHSGSAMEPLSPCLFFPSGAAEAVVRASREAAFATDTPVLIASTSGAGHFSYAAGALGIPGLLLERGHSGLCAPEWVAGMRHNVRLLLRHLAVYPYDEPDRVCAKKVYGHNTYLTAGEQGLWHAAVSEDTQVKAGEMLGWMEDMWGNRIAEYRAAYDARVFYYTGSLAVKAGDALVAYGAEAM